MAADLFIAVYHDSVPDDFLETWEYEGRTIISATITGYAIFISNDNGDPAGSLAFGKFLGTELQARGLAIPPHYALPLMRHRRRELVDADAGVYRYDQLIVLQRTRMPAGCLKPARLSTGRRSWNWQVQNAVCTPARRSPRRWRIFARRAVRHDDRAAP